MRPMGWSLWSEATTTSHSANRTDAAPTDTPSEVVCNSTLEILMQRIELLRRTGLFAALTSGELEQTASSSVERHFTKGEVVIREGDHASSMFIVI